MSCPRKILCRQSLSPSAQRKGLRHISVADLDSFLQAFLKLLDFDVELLDCSFDFGEICDGRLHDFAGSALLNFLYEFLNCFLKAGQLSSWSSLHSRVRVLASIMIFRVPFYLGLNKVRTKVIIIFYSKPIFVFFSTIILILMRF